MIPWKNSWFQLGLAAVLLAGGILLLDLSKRVSGSGTSTPASNTNDQKNNAPPAGSNPPPPSSDSDDPPATGILVSLPGIYTYNAPDGWNVKGSGENKVVVGTGDPPPTIGMMIRTYDGSLEDYINYVLNGFSSAASMQDIQVRFRDPFKTDAGVAGVRLTYTVRGRPGEYLWETCFFFDAGGSRKVSLIGVCKLQDAPNIVSNFESSARTLILFPPKANGDSKR